MRKRRSEWSNSHLRSPKPFSIHLYVHLSWFKAIVDFFSWRHVEQKVCFSTREEYIHPKPNKPQTKLNNALKKQHNIIKAIWKCWLNELSITRERGKWNVQHLSYFCTSSFIVHSNKVKFIFFRLFEAKIRFVAATATFFKNIVKPLPQTKERKI
jgi:hypothetical protein